MAAALLLTCAPPGALALLRAAMSPAATHRTPCVLGAFRLGACKMDASKDKESEDRKAAILSKFASAEGLKESSSGTQEKGGSVSDDWIKNELDLLTKGEGEIAEFVKEFVSALLLRFGLSHGGRAAAGICSQTVRKGAHLPHT
eukprot:scaffold83830_cov33-Tisochrysis_lutea.AAC.1